jgi:N-acetyltransferase 10
MGYGSRALKALNSFYSGEYFNLVSENTLTNEPSYPDATSIDDVSTVFSLKAVNQLEPD